MQDLTQLTDQKLRELFWYYEGQIKAARERPRTDTEADSKYGSARRGLVGVAEELAKRAGDDDVLEMDGKPWTHYL